MIIDPKLNPPTLIGEHVRLRPIQATDSAAYYAIAPVETFRFFVSQIPKGQSTDGFQSYVDFIVENASIQGFTCELISDGMIVGGTTLMDIRPNDDQVEIGMTWYTPTMRGTFVNPECKLLLLTYAFEVLGCTKVTLKCDNRNEHSKRAILKLGATHEGVLRRHRMTDFGEYRDTAYYGIFCEDWPSVKDNLLKRLSAYE
ncbi:MAG: GNAT family protein [Armatimonadota bacterium]